VFSGEFTPWVCTTKNVPIRAAMAATMAAAIAPRREMDDVFAGFEGIG